MAFWKWSRVAADNATATGGTWAEGMAPSQINDTARINAAELACYRDDVAGAIVTGGTSTAYTVASYSSYDTLAHLNGQLIAFSPHTTNGATVTLSVDGLGQKPLRSAPGVELLAGTIIQGTPYCALYSASDGAFYLNGFYGNPYSIPLAGGLDYWGATAPNSSFAFPTGQQISQTTYAALYAIFGSNRYGTDAGGNFFLPDKTGRVSAMKEAAASRLTATYFGGNSTVLGANGGGESHLLTTGEIPAHNHTATDSGHTHPNGAPTGTGLTGNASGFPAQGSTIWNGSPGNTGSSTANITVANTGGGGAHAIVQPTIVCNYIIRII